MKPAELFDLSNEIAVVIGATGALGGALADGLANAGAKVAVLGRSADRGERRVAAIRSKGGTAGFFAADAVKKDSLHAAHQAILDWCANHGHALAGPNWEIYGHWLDAWNSDPSQIRTDVFYLISTAGPSVA